MQIRAWSLRGVLCCALFYPMACASTRPAPGGSALAAGAPPGASPGATTGAGAAPGPPPASAAQAGTSTAGSASAQGSPASGASPIPARTIARASSALDAGLSSPDETVRTEALTALGFSGRADARQRLSSALFEEHGPVRFAAAQGFRYLKDPSAGADLLTAWRRERGWAVKAELARAAATCRARQLVRDLKFAARDPHRELAVSAAWALSDLGDPAGPRALARLGHPPRKEAPPGEGADRWARKVLKGEKDGDLSVAARGLGELGTPADADVLAPHLDSASPRVRIWAAASLLRLGAPQDGASAPQPAMKGSVPPT